MPMTFGKRLAALASRARLPRRSVRLRLTLLYGGLFLSSGAVLLAITYLLVRHTSVISTHTFGPVRQARAGQASPLPKLPSLQALQTRAQHDLARQHASDMHQLLVW